MIELVGNSWDNILQEEYHKKYFVNLIKYINKQYKEKTIYPPKRDILKALKLTEYNDVKVVILGQDPYHGEHEANGLAFSVNDGVRFPPSLQNIYKELLNDLGTSIPSSGNLECWAQEGILLLNSILTVEKDKASSHKDIGWETFTDEIIKKLNDKEESIVFILWGNYAKSKSEYITNPNHYVITSVHPSPLSASRGFFGSKPFSKTNNYLISKGIKPIDFTVNNQYNEIKRC